MSQDFQSGDYLVFQIESGFGLLRILHIEGDSESRIWHLQAFEDLFPDVDSADAAVAESRALSVSLPHIALTHRAFEATQVARLANHPLGAAERELVSRAEGTVSDRSIRLMLGLR